MPFAALPAVPQSGVSDWQFQFLNSVKQNIEELTGQTGTGFRSVLAGNITTQLIGELESNVVTLSGTGYTISGTQNVPTLEDFVLVASTVQQLVQDVYTLRATINTLIQQLQS